MAYDKGNPQGITRLAVGVYAVESFHEEMKTYRVDLNANRCDCPHFSKRLADAGGQQDCKHMTAARAYRFQQISEKAKALPTERLEELKEKWFGQDKAIWLAIDGELHDRAQAQMKQSLRDTQLKQLFA
jgi:hypothetical protein